VDWRELKLVYRRYASLLFVVAVDQDDNELITLEMIHLFVEVLDKHFGNVCELDLVFNFYKAYWLLDEVFLAGERGRSERDRVERNALLQCDWTRSARSPPCPSTSTLPPPLPRRAARAEQEGGQRDRADARRDCGPVHRGLRFLMRRMMAAIRTTAEAVRACAATAHAAQPSTAPLAR